MTSTRPQSEDAHPGDLDVEDLRFDDLRFDLLAASRRHWARGVNRIEAAVDLLIARGTGLNRSDFRAHALRSTLTAPERVWIDRRAAAGVADRSPGSACDVAMLHIALTLAGFDTGDNLGVLVNGLGCTRTTTVVNAIAHIAAWHQGGFKVVVTGRVAADRTTGLRHA